MMLTDRFADLGLKFSLRRLVILSACAPLLLAGCAVTSLAGRATSSAGSVPTDSYDLDSEKLLFGEINNAAIPAGKCGMILWTLHDRHPRPVFVYILGEGARAVVNGEVVELPLVEASGVSRYGVAERQNFASENGFDASVRVAFGLGFDGGQYLERGVITLETADGWRAVTPTAGLVGCRRKG